MDDGTSALTGSPAPGPSGLGAAEDLAGADWQAATLQRANWKALGFAAPPRVLTADGRRLYRVWGGTSLERGDPRSPGVFCSFERPTSRMDAERRFAIAEFGNACRFVSEFEVATGTVMLVGPVDPGDVVDPKLADAGDQVFVPNPAAQCLMLVGAATRLEDDLGGRQVYTGPRPRKPA
jgi:hypothetical protein